MTDRTLTDDDVAIDNVIGELRALLAAPHVSPLPWKYGQCRIEPRISEVWTLDNKTLARAAVNALPALLADRDASLARAETETAIVDRVWKALGISTFEGAEGKAIDEIVADWKARAEAAEARLAALDRAGRPVEEIAREIAHLHNINCGGGKFMGDGGIRYHTAQCDHLTAKITSALTAERLAAGGREERMTAALSAIESMADEEIKARFGHHHSKTAEELGRNSAIYHLLVLPRDIARNALAALSQPAHEEDSSRG